MGRANEGPSVSWHKGVWRVRFTHPETGARIERSTRVTDERDRAAATRAGLQIFAAIISGLEPDPEPAERIDASTPLGAAVAAWLGELTDVGQEMRGYCELIAARWLVDFVTLDRFTDQVIARHTRRRLGEVSGKTVRNELSVLRKFLAWCVETERLRSVPNVPTVRKSVAGTKHSQPRRVRAGEYDPEAIERFLELLPERSASGFVVRARLVVAYETTLRPRTLDKLRAPENYRRGARVITITDHDDKELYGREVPLTARAREALDKCCPVAGEIFGRHRLDPYVRRAARAAGLPESARRHFCAQHLRSAGITAYLESPGASLAGVARIAGHRHVSTTAGYTRPSARAAAAAVAARDRIVGGETAGVPPQSPKMPRK